MRGLFGSISAHGHAAPPTSPSVVEISEQQGAPRTFASLHTDRTPVAKETRNHLGNREQKRFRPRAATNGVKSQRRRRVCPCHDHPLECVVRRKKVVQAAYRRKIRGVQRTVLSHRDKCSKPFTQVPNLRRQFVKRRTVHAC